MRTIDNLLCPHQNVIAVLAHGEPRCGCRLRRPEDPAPVQPNSFAAKRERISFTPKAPSKFGA